MYLRTSKAISTLKDALGGETLPTKESHKNSCLLALTLKVEEIRLSENLQL